uniref:DOG1 domain-containing protein n=1 Tax=Kalanchoe fedtschenkoi TaxID=63787 RepID=A0A7N0ZY22_KALFE
MSFPPSSNLYMSSAIRNGASERETFHKFFECWLVEQNQFLHSLISASKHLSTAPAPAPSRHRDDSNGRITDSELRQLIDRVTRHYEDYYRVKSRCAKQDVFTMLSPSWLSSLESAFLWMGGWRPTMAFHLLYSKSGMQLEAALADLIRGLSTGDLADLSPSQLSRIDELQRRTIREEKLLTERMAAHQETVADHEMVELSQAVTEMLQSGGGGGDEDARVDMEERVESTLKPKEEGLEAIVEEADDLRLRTLKGILEVLTPVQAVHFLIAAAELHLRLHEWGKKKDAGAVGGARE